MLAAGRGPDDPMARAFGVSHKCLVDVGGMPMLARVLATLRAHPAIGRIGVSIENEALVEQAVGSLPEDVFVTPSKESAAASAAAALPVLGHPVLLTTADHVLLDGAMLDHFMAQSATGSADLTVGLARAETILAAYPETRRTFLRFGPDRVSGCNLFGLMTPDAARAIAFWQTVERNRKRPWRLIAAFGAVPLLVATGAGAESRRSIGAVVFFGVTVAVLLTLVVVPAVDLVFDAVVRKVDLPIEVRQVVLVRPLLDLTIGPIRSSVAV